MIGLPSAPRRRVSVPLALMLLASVAYLVIGVTIGRFPNLDGDEIFYKAPGRELAATGHFRSPELTGYLGVTPPLEKAWLVYPPLYPALYGATVKLFGFGWRQSTGFDAAIHLGVAWLAVLLFARYTKRPLSWLALACFLSILLLGTLGRPDDLATAFGLLGVSCLIRPFTERKDRIDWRELLASGICFGLCAATSPVACFVIGWIALPLVITRSGGVSRALVPLSAWVMVAVAVLLLAVLPVLLNSPRAYQQFLDQAHLVTTTDTRSLTQRLWYVFTAGRRQSVPLLAALGLGLVALATAWKGRLLADWTHLWLGIFLAVASLLFMRIHNYSYLWFVLPFSLVACFAAVEDAALFGRGAGRVVALGALALAVGFGASQYFKETLLLANLPREQTLDYNAELVRREVPRGSVIMTYDLWWSLANDYRAFEHQVSRRHWDDVEFVVSTTGSPIGIDHSPMTPRDQYIAAHFENALDARTLIPKQILGMTLSRGFHGFGVHILKRKTTYLRAGER